MISVRDPRYRLIGLAALSLALQGPVNADEEIPQPAAPAIAGADQKFLTWVARRVLDQASAQRAPYELTYRPATLADVNCQVAVTLRMGGYKRGVGVSAKAPVCDGIRDAALAAWQDARQKGKADAATLGRMCIEIEVIGEVAPAPTIPSWSSVQSYRYIQRGIHGLVVRFIEAQAALRPSEFIADNTSFQEAVETFAARANPGGEFAEARFVSWFRTTHWHELEPGGEVVELRRGLVVLPQSAVTREGLTQAIETIGDFMVYRQRPSGEFAYQYDPSVDVYRDEVSDLRQAGCAWTLAILAQTTGLQPVSFDRARTLAAADRTLEMLAPRVVELEGVEGASFLRATTGTNKLGATALLALALGEHPQPVERRALRDRLVKGIQWLQTAEGRFITIFPPSLNEAGQDYAPGQALLALARAYQDEPREGIARAFEAALPFYRDHFRKAPSAPLAAWQAQAFARMARLSPRREYADFAFELADWLAVRQLHERNCAWPELYGGIDVFGDGEVGVATATYLEALAEALILARELTDTGRVERYESVVRAAARFVMQLQFRREEAYYVHSPRDCVGGVRAAPADNRIRIEQCAHALRALIRTREVLFPEQ